MSLGFIKTNNLTANTLSVGIIDIGTIALTDSLTGHNARTGPGIHINGSGIPTPLTTDPNTFSGITGGIVVLSPPGNINFTLTSASDFLQQTTIIVGQHILLVVQNDGPGSVTIVPGADMTVIRGPIVIASGTKARVMFIMTSQTTVEIFEIQP